MPLQCYFYLEHLSMGCLTSNKHEQSTLLYRHTHGYMHIVQFNFLLPFCFLSAVHIQLYVTYCLFFCLTFDFCRFCVVTRFCVCQLVYWCEVWSAVCCVLVTSRFQSSLLDSPAMCEKEVVCQSYLPLYSLLVDKPFVQPPSWRCTVTEHLTTSGWSTWVTEEVCP